MKEPELIREYNQTIEDQLSKGIVERVPAEEIRLKKESEHAVIRTTP